MEEWFITRRDGTKKLTSINKGDSGYGCTYSLISLE